MTKRRKTPQEKKILSYAKDCRNNYGENDKSARKTIPRRKQQQRQNERRVLKANLKKSVEGSEELVIERPKLGMWRKICLLYTSPSPRDATLSRMPSSA